MSIYITNEMFNELKSRAETVLGLSTNPIQKRAVNRLLAVVDWIELTHLRQKQKITARVNKMRKINKNYGRPKPKEA